MTQTQKKQLKIYKYIHFAQKSSYKIIESSLIEGDYYAANFGFIVHKVGKILSKEL